MDFRSWGILVAFVLGTLALGIGSGLTATRTPQDYQELEQPRWAPPTWLFGPAWSVLYVMIGAAAFLVWQTQGWGLPLGLWGGQFLLTLIWTPLFFGAGLRGLALIEISVLWVAVLTTIVAFWAVSRVAAGLMMPYLAWVTFATALNAAIWNLNR